MSNENTTNDVKLYELGFHLDPAITEDKVSSKIDGIKKVLLDNGAEVVKEGEAKAMKLSYEITKAISGKNIRFNTSTFSWVKFNATVEGIESIKEEIDSDDEVIRSIIVKTTDDEEHSTSKIANEEEEAEMDEKEAEESEPTIEPKEIEKKLDEEENSDNSDNSTEESPKAEVEETEEK